MVTLDRECRRNAKNRKTAVAPDDAGKVPPPEPEAEQPAGSKPGILRWSRLPGCLAVLMPLLGLLVIVFNLFKAIDINQDGMAAYEAGDYEAAEKHFRAAAELGYGAAQTNLAWMYANGQGVEQDLNEAAKWFRKAAEQGFDMAQFNLGGCYVVGEGVERDKAEAVKWFRKAAKQGCAEAQFSLGVLYYIGAGVQPDKTKAVKWWHKASEQGHAASQFMMGYC
ncbi:MAG: sel1 repeat family protein, partial [Lentisphaeria bacterium]|nr:sel1 repeat family protein [Lentisphaeria bacterium]